MADGIALAACATAFASLVLLAGCEDAADNRATAHDATSPANVEEPMEEEPGDAPRGDSEESPTDNGQGISAPAVLAAPAETAEPGDIVERDVAGAIPGPEHKSAAASAEDAAAISAAAPQRIDPGALFIGAAPVHRAALSPRLTERLDEIRRAMRRREFLTIRQHLQAAAADRRSGADREAYERMLLVHALWTQGWSHAIAAAGELGPGDRIDTWAGPALVQDKTDRAIMLRIDGKPQTFSTRISEMEVRLAAALVEHRARETGLALDAHAAALWIFAGEDDEDLPASAREAIIEAVQRGAYVDHLIAELRSRQASASAAR